MNKLGGLFPKKQIPPSIIDNENPDDEPSLEVVSEKISTNDDKKKH